MPVVRWLKKDENETFQQSMIVTMSFGNWRRNEEVYKSTLSGLPKTLTPLAKLAQTY